LATLQGHVQQVTTVTFHPDGHLLASRSWEGVLRLWDVSTGRQLLQLPAPYYLRFSRDGRWLGVAAHGEEGRLLEVAATREYRTIVSSLGADQGSYAEGDISPDGRLLALDMVENVNVWHLPGGRELVKLPPGLPLFHPDGRELLIVGRDGLQRRSMQFDGNELRLEAPRTIPLPAAPMRVVRTQDGGTLAIVSEARGTAFLVDLAAEAVREPAVEHPLAGFVALSPNGQWLATSGWHSDRVRLWNAATGEKVHEWAMAATRVFFTPDSRTLVLGRAEDFSFWDLERLKPLASGKSLQPVLQLRRDVAFHPGHSAFAPKTKLMAMEMAPGVVHLKDIATGRTVAKLEDPHGDRATWMCFTPDGTELVVVALYARAIHVWNLRAIRERLKTMNLDWDWPEFPPSGG
jgi:WD40 repeat protein